MLDGAKNKVASSRHKDFIGHWPRLEEAAEQVGVLEQAVSLAISLPCSSFWSSCWWGFAMRGTPVDKRRNSALLWGIGLTAKPSHCTPRHLDLVCIDDKSGGSVPGRAMCGELSLAVVVESLAWLRLWRERCRMKPGAVCNRLVCIAKRRQERGSGRGTVA